MPTLQDELKTILPAWEEEQTLIERAKQINHNPKATMEQVIKRHLFKPSNNASRETFNAVRDFPNQQPVFYADMLTKKGFKHTTVRSLIYQMTRQGQFNQDHAGNLSAKANAYVPLKASKTMAGKKTTAKAPVQSAGIGALTVKADPQVKYTFKEQAAWKPEDTVDQLTLVQAKAVHVYLQKIFGG
jgi:hypothetical protein